MQLEVYQDATGFDALAKEWNDLLHRSDSDTIFLTHEWQRTWWHFFSKNRDLLLLAVRQGKELIGIAPFYRQQTKDGRIIIQLVGGADICDYLAVITLPDYHSSVYQTIFEFLTTKMCDWNEIDLHCIPEISFYQPLCEAATQHKLSVQRQVEDVCPFIPLPSQWDDYLAMLNKKQRHELRRKMRRAEREVQTDWYMTSDPETLAQDIEIFFDLHRKSSPGKQDFMSDSVMQEFFHEMARFTLEKGWLELSFLLLNNKKAATMLCFKYNNRTLVYNSGYDPQQFRHLSPGIVLLGYHIQDSIAKGRTVFDFLRGDEIYKYRFGGQDQEIFQITIKHDHKN